MKILILGDTHISSRRRDVPEWVKEIVERGWDIILHTGDVEEGWVLEYLSRYGEVYVVRGNMDYLRLPEFRVIDTDLGRILLIHGHQVHPRGNVEQLTALGRTAGTKIVVSGHTHKPKMKKVDNIYLINPGTATGAWGGSYEGGDESLVIIEDGRAKLYINGKISSTLSLSG